MAGRTAVRQRAPPAVQRHHLRLGIIRYSLNPKAGYVGRGDTTRVSGVLMGRGHGVVGRKVWPMHGRAAAASGPPRLCSCDAACSMEDLQGWWDDRTGRELQTRYKGCGLWLAALQPAAYGQSSGFA